MSEPYCKRDAHNCPFFETNQCEHLKTLQAEIERLKDQIRLGNGILVEEEYFESLKQRIKELESELRHKENQDEKCECCGKWMNCESAVYDNDMVPLCEKCYNSLKEK